MANSEVKLYGMWASPFVRRVELTLRIKGIPFEYIEENLRKKSQQLLQYNPVHKRVPVLLHNGKPLCESLVIIEYIEETWHHSPRVLPEVPYERANVRFWANFIDQKILEQMRTILKYRTQENISELMKSLDVLEEQMDSIFPSGINPTVIGESLGLLDILIATFSGAIGAYEEAIEVKFVDPEKHQAIVLWIKAVDAVQVVKETVPSHEKLVEFFRSFGKK